MYLLVNYKSVITDVIVVSKHLYFFDGMCCKLLEKSVNGSEIVKKAWSLVSVVDLKAKVRKLSYAAEHHVEKLRYRFSYFKSV